MLDHFLFLDNICGDRRAYQITIFIVPLRLSIVIHNFTSMAVWAPKACANAGIVFFMDHRGTTTKQTLYFFHMNYYTTDIVSLPYFLLRAKINPQSGADCTVTAANAVSISMNTTIEGDIIGTFQIDTR